MGENGPNENIVRVKEVVVEYFRVPEQRWGDKLRSDGPPDPQNLLRYSRSAGWIDRVAHLKCEFLKATRTKPHSHGGACTVTITLDNFVVILGESYCSLSDPFCYKTGRQLALERALQTLYHSPKEETPRWDDYWKAFNDHTLFVVYPEA